MAHAFSRLGSAFSGSSSTSSYNSGDIDIEIDTNVEEGIFAAGESHPTLHAIFCIPCFLLQQLMRVGSAWFVHFSWYCLLWCCFGLCLDFESTGEVDRSIELNVQECIVAAGETSC